MLRASSQGDACYPLEITNFMMILSGYAHGPAHGGPVPQQLGKVEGAGRGEEAAEGTRAEGEGGGRTEIKQIMYIYLNLISYAQSRYFVAIGCKEIDIPNCCKKTLKLFRKTLTRLI